LCSPRRNATEGVPYRGMRRVILVGWPTIECR
jgi:hypothetical protein